MAKWDAGVAYCSTTAKGGKNTYDDNEERVVIEDEFNNNILVNTPYRAYPNDKLHPMDLRIVDENGKIHAWVEIERNGMDKTEWKNAASVLGRKVKNVLKYNKIGQVIMIFVNKPMNTYFYYCFDPKHLENYPLGLIFYTPEKKRKIIEQRQKEGRPFPESPFDYKHYIPSKEGVFRNIMKGMK